MNKTKSKKFDVIIVAGGKGTRLKKIHKNVKILINLDSKKTLLGHIIDNLQQNNIKSATIMPGKNSDLIKNYLYKKNIKSFDLHFIEEKKLLGTAGCLLKLNYNNLKNDLLIIYGDLLLNIDTASFYEKHISANSDVTLFSHPSDHLEDSDILDVDEKNNVNNISFKPHKKKIISRNLTMAGIFFIKKKLIKLIPKNKKFDFSRDFLKLLLKRKYKIFSYHSREYCTDMGTPNRLKNAKKDYKLLKHKYYSLKNKLPAVFLDRDGVINKDQGPLKYSNPFNFLNGSLKGLQLLRNSKYLIFLITNQGAIAKGIISYELAISSFKKYEIYLSKNKFYFDKIYFCPHHPKKGFLNENKKFKINCNCRKPKPGLIFRAQKEFNIDLKKSYFIGDSLNDYLAAKRAGVKSIMIKRISNYKMNCIYNNSLLSAAKFILNR